MEDRLFMARYETIQLISFRIGQVMKMDRDPNALLVEKLGPASGMLYWDGAAYRWYQ